MPNANMSFYVNMRTIEVIHKSLDIPLGRGMGGDDKPVMNGGGGSEDEGEELEEELEEEVREDLQNGYDWYIHGQKSHGVLVTRCVGGR